MTSLKNEYHSLKQRSDKRETTLGFFVPIKRTNKVKLFLKSSDGQITHRSWFGDSIQTICNKLNDSKLTASEYQVIPRFRYLHKKKVLYIPLNFEFDSMITTYIIEQIGLIDIYEEIKIVETKAENIVNIWNLKDIVSV